MVIVIAGVHRPTKLKLLVIAHAVSPGSLRFRLGLCFGLPLGLRGSFPLFLLFVLFVKERFLTLKKIFLA